MSFTNTSNNEMWKDPVTLNNDQYEIELTTVTISEADASTTVISDSQNNHSTTSENMHELIAIKVHSLTSPECMTHWDDEIKEHLINMGLILNTNVQPGVFILYIPDDVSNNRSSIISYIKNKVWQ